MILPAPTFVDFFAGSGLVTQGVRHACEPVWWNDICAKKAAMDTANHGDGHFHLGSIEHVRGAAIPAGDIVWASFLCRDLSLACEMGGASPPPAAALDQILPLKAGHSNSTGICWAFASDFFN